MPSILLHRQALGALQIIAEELHRFLLRLRLSTEKISQGIPSAANVGSHPLRTQAID